MRRSFFGPEGDPSILGDALEGEARRRPGTADFRDSLESKSETVAEKRLAELIVLKNEHDSEVARKPEATLRDNIINIDFGKTG